MVHYGRSSLQAFPNSVVSHRTLFPRVGLAGQTVTDWPPARFALARDAIMQKSSEDSTSSSGLRTGTHARWIPWMRMVCHQCGKTAQILAVASISLAFLVMSEPALAIVWDEGYSLGREARIRAWVGALRDPKSFAEHWQPPIEDLVQPSRFRPPSRDQLDTRAELLSPAVLDWFWPFAREEPDGHPPVYALIGLVG